MIRAVAEVERAGAVGLELIQRISQGDERALAELYDLTSRVIFSLVLRVVGDGAAAEQVTLDVYQQVWRTASNYTPDQGSVNGWLASAARSHALEWLRFRARTDQEVE